MPEPRRVLIDWDFGATGIWNVLTRQELLAPRSTQAGAASPARARPARAWSDLLSTPLLDDLQRWNDECGRAARDGGMTGALEERARLLAMRTQDELGTADTEVLYKAGAVIYRVHPPGRWPVQSWKQDLLGYPPGRQHTGQDPTSAP